MPNKIDKFKVLNSKSQVPRNTSVFFLGLGIWILGLGTFSGCKEPDISALGVQPGSEKLGLLNTDTATLIAYTLPEDSFHTNSTSLNLLGIYNDNVFGLAEAAIYSQVRLSADAPDFGNASDLIVDSLILSLAYAGWYSDTSKTPDPQNFKVYELTEDMNADSPYYSTKTFQYNIAEIGKIVNAVPSLTDSAVVGGISEPPQLRIPLSVGFGQQLLTAGASVYQNTNEFLKYFKGFLIKPDYVIPPSSGNGSIIYFNLLSSYSKMTIYYRNLSDTDTLKFDFNINDKCARITNFKLTQSGTTQIFSSNTDTIYGKDLIYIQSMGGARGKIKFPYLAQFVPQGKKIAVNKAEIILNVESGSNDKFPSHNNLFLAVVDSLGKAEFLIDQFEGADHYGGTYDASAKQYVFNATRHFQFLFTTFSEGKNYNYGLYLIAGGRAVNANRTIIKGNTYTDKNSRIKLKISYTPL